MQSTEQELRTRELEGRVREYLVASADAKRDAAAQCGPAVVAAAALVATTFRGGGRVLLCGNGGSAADCQHIAAEFVSVLTQSFVRPALAAIALTTDTSFLTASANDFGFEMVFARQVEALGRPGDTLIGITTSGGSRNVLRALGRAREIGMHTVVLTGAAAGASAALADVAVEVPSRSTQHIQEIHIAIGHVLCHVVEGMLFPDGPTGTYVGGQP